MTRKSKRPLTGADVGDVMKLSFKPVEQVSVAAQQLMTLLRTLIYIDDLPRAVDLLADDLARSSNGVICVGCYGLPDSCLQSSVKCCPDCTHARESAQANPTSSDLEGRGTTDAPNTTEDECT